MKTLFYGTARKYNSIRRLNVIRPTFIVSCSKACLVKCRNKSQEISWFFAQKTFLPLTVFFVNYVDARKRNMERKTHLRDFTGKQVKVSVFDTFILAFYFVIFSDVVVDVIGNYLSYAYTFIK